jgi:hypothetical protein
MLRVATICIVALLSALPAYAASRENAHVRPVGADIAALIDDGAKRSPTLRTLIDDLQRTDVTVFVEYENGLASDLAGALRFITRAGSLRLLRVSLRRTLTRAQLLKTLGHELHHALEIASAPEVVDEKSLRRFYQRLGHETGLYDRFDTSEAQRAGDTVGDELRGRRTESAGVLASRTVPPAMPTVEDKRPRRDRSSTKR